MISTLMPDYRYIIKPGASGKIFSFYQNVAKKCLDIEGFIGQLERLTGIGQLLEQRVRRAATSITDNLAEGSGRQSPKEKIHFIEIAFGSMTEVFCEPTYEARAEISLLNLCLARRRKTKSTADSLRSAIYKRRAARCLTSPVHRSSQDALWPSQLFNL